MAITPIKENTFSSYPMKDSRAEGYVTYYTKMKWDRFKMAAEQVAQDVAAKTATYEAALKFYQSQAKDIQDERQFIQKQINDITIRRANVVAKQNEIVYKEEARRAQLKAKIPSHSESSSQGTSESSGTSFWYSKYPGMKKKKDTQTAAPAVDAKRVQELRDSISGTVGQLNDAAGSDGFNAGDSYYENVVKTSKAAGYTEEEIAAAAQPLMNEALIESLPASTIQVKSPEIEEKPLTSSRKSSSQRTSQSSSTGASQGDYTLPELDALAQSKSAVEEYDARLANLNEQLKAEGLQVDSLKAPVMEPIDSITATRKAYFDKFGDVPRNTNLNIQGEKTQHKGIAPFELTAAMHKTEQFFKMYIDDAVATAKRAAGGELSVDELNVAVELGKKTARDVLFGGLAAREASQAQKEGSVPPPNAASPQTPQALSAQLKTEADIDNANRKALSTTISGTALAELNTLAPVAPPTIGYAPTRQPGLPTIAPTPDFQRPLGRPDTSILTGRLTDPPPIDIGTKQEGDIPQYPGYMDEPGYNPFSPKTPSPSYTPQPWMPSTQPGLAPEKKKYPTGPVEQGSKRIMNADDKDRMAKAKAFMEAAKSVDKSPSVVASKIVKTPAGKYVAALYDENKARGAQAKDIGTLVQQVTREYAGDSAAQKAAVQRLIELSMLDSNSKKLS